MNEKNVNKSNYKIILYLIFLLILTATVSATAISNQIHLNVQVTNDSGSILTGTYNFTFNISSDSTCTSIVYTNTTEQTTDDRGIISQYLPNVNINFTQQYWLCYYRDYSLKSNVSIAQVPYSYYAKNVSASGVTDDSNLNLATHNITADFGSFNLDGSNITSGTVADARIASTIARDSEVVAEGTANAWRLVKANITDFPTLLSSFTDDLGHIEDNTSWNESYADTKYATIGAGADNTSWNQTLADSLYITEYQNLSELDVEGYIFDADNTGTLLTTGNITANTMYADNWTNITITEAQILDLQTYLTSYTETDPNIAGNLTIIYTNILNNATALRGNIDGNISITNSNINNNISLVNTNIGNNYSFLQAEIEVANTSGNTSFNQTLTDSLYITEYQNLSEADVEGYVFDADNTGTLLTTGNITANTIYADNWTNITITESQITDLTHTVDTNESVQVAALVASNTTIFTYADNINTTANIEELGFVTGAHTVEVDPNIDANISLVNTNINNNRTFINTDIINNMTSAGNTYVNLTGDTMTGNLVMGQNNITLNNVTLTQLPGREEIDGGTFALMMTNPPNGEVPHLVIQSGGASQMSVVARSFGIVDESVDILNSTNRTNCFAWADHYGVALKIDCNTTTTGADLFVGDDMQVNGDVWVRDSDGEWHYMTRTLSLIDQLFSNLVLNDLNFTTTGTNFSFIGSQNNPLVININANETILSYTNSGITLLNGSNSTPNKNYVYYQNQNNPTLTISTSEPALDDDFAEVARFIVGDNGYVYGSIIDKQSQYDGIKGIYSRLLLQRPLYVSGYTPQVGTTSFNVTAPGRMMVMIHIDEETNNLSTTTNFFRIRNDGSYVQNNTIDAISQYGDGTSIGNNKFFNVVFGVVHNDAGDNRLMAVVQSGTTEYVSLSDAQIDANQLTKFLPADTDISRLFIPIARVVMKRTGSTNTIQTLSTGNLYLDLRGTANGVGGSGASPSITDHAALTNLEYTLSGHTGFAASDTIVNISTVNAWNIAGENITSGTVADDRIASTIARDSEVVAIGTANAWNIVESNITDLGTYLTAEVDPNIAGNLTIINSNINNNRTFINTDITNNITAVNTNIGNNYSFLQAEIEVANTSGNTSFNQTLTDSLYITEYQNLSEADVEGYVFDADNTGTLLTTGNITANTMYADNWTNITITESQILDLQAYLTSYTETDPNIGANISLVNTNINNNRTTIYTQITNNITLVNTDINNNVTNINTNIANNVTAYYGNLTEANVEAYIFDADNTGTLLTTGNITANTMYADNWTNITITEAQILDLQTYLTSYTETDPNIAGNLTIIYTNIINNATSIRSNIDQNITVVNTNINNNATSIYSGVYTNLDNNVTAIDVNIGNNYTYLSTAINAGNLTEDQVEAMIFDADNTANLNLNNYNVTGVAVIELNNTQTITSNSTCIIMTAGTTTFNICT